MYIYIYIYRDWLAKLRPWDAILSGPGCARPGRAFRAGPGNKIQICAPGANLNFGKTRAGPGKQQQDNTIQVNFFPLGPA